MKEILKIFQGAVDYPYEQKLAVLNEQFCRMAKELLYGGYFLIEGKKHLYLDDIEFYYHEEGDNGLKAPIMYHTNDNEGKGKAIPYFEIGRLHLHISGVDVTFENEDKQYRASFLIRGFHMDNQEYDGHSTHVYEEMLYMGVPLGKPIEIEWISKRQTGYADYKPTGEPRKNVAEYELKDGKYIKIERRDESFDEKVHFRYSKHDYRKCQRKWRFRKEHIIIKRT